MNTMNTIKPLQNLDEIKSRPDVVRLKHLYGAIYGIFAGLAFAVSSWGVDAYILQGSHAYYPWLKFVIGTILCGLIGFIPGWLTNRRESTLLGVLIWLGSAFLFAWLSTALPLQIVPALIARLDPELGRLMNYAAGDGFVYRYFVSLMWITPFLFITGILQLPVVESGVFSTSVFGKITPYILCIIIMGISGLITDSLIDVHFREAIVALDNTIEFVVENEGIEVDPLLSRKMHAASLRSATEYLSDDRYLIVGEYTESLDTMNVLARFEGKWFDCTVVYNQPAFCKPVTIQ